MPPEIDPATARNERSGCVWRTANSHAAELLDRDDLDHQPALIVRSGATMNAAIRFPCASVLPARTTPGRPGVVRSGSSWSGPVGGLTHGEKSAGAPIASAPISAAVRVALHESTGKHLLNRSSSLCAEASRVWNACEATTGSFPTVSDSDPVGRPHQRQQPQGSSHLGRRLGGASQVDCQVTFIPSRSADPIVEPTAGEPVVTARIDWVPHERRSRH